MNAEIHAIVEQWKDGLVSDGETLTRLIAIQSQALDAVALVTVQINDVERLKADQMAATLRRG